jgi:4-hydroxy-tetrahydrodipicolinate reductase
MTSRPLRIALIGYGTMGKEIERLAPRHGCEITQIFTSAQPLVYERLSIGTAAELDASLTSLRTGFDTDFGFDVAIDFSTPASVGDNVRTLTALGKNVVIGTTGWFGQKESALLACSIQQSVLQASTGAVWGANFSVGVQMFFRIVQAAAELASTHEDYDLALHEVHHRRKLDSPSGTAAVLAEIVQHAVQRKTSLLVGKADGRIAQNALHSTSTRVGDVPGTHTLYLDSAADTLELTHRARNRSGFASGALRAARWIHGKQGWYDFADIFAEI